jgi:hypothetical protein
LELSPGWALDEKSDRVESYNPAEIPTLFRIFADAPATPQGMQAFSNKFGLPTESHGVRSRSFSTLVGPLLYEQAVIREAISLFEAHDHIKLANLFNSPFVQSKGQLRLELRVQPDGKIGYVHVPSGLSGAMWLQLAQHIASEAKLLRCVYCNAPIRVGPGTGRRSSARYCQNACKVAAFRKRHHPNAKTST